MGLSWKTVPLELIKDRMIFLSVLRKDNITYIYLYKKELFGALLLKNISVILRVTEIGQSLK